MTISLKTHKMLWGRAGNRCAYADCRRELVEDAIATDDPSLIGEECHIAARQDDGPRGDPSFPIEQRDKYDNLILLCNVHHKIVDDQPATYTVELLKSMKSTHEQWVREALQGFDPIKQRDDEYYAWLIDEWARLADVEEWKAWTSHLLSGDWPQVRKDTFTQLQELREWLFSRVWSGRYPELDAAFENFRMVLADFCEVFDEHREEHRTMPETHWSTEKFYKTREFNQAQYDWLLRQYEFHVDLVQDLTLELTRAANYLCDQIRKHVDPWYRLRDGILLVETGPNMRLQYVTMRVSYQPNERTLHPYPGLEAFKAIRETRDTSFGKGENANTEPNPDDNDD